MFWPWQVVSYAFLHGDMLHLFFNMLGLWMFGAELERLWGQKRYAVPAGRRARGGGHAAADHLADRLDVPTVGASGALFGLLLAFGMLFPNRIIMPLIPPIPMKAKPSSSSSACSNWCSAFMAAAVSRTSRTWAACSAAS